MNKKYMCQQLHPKSLAVEGQPWCGCHNKQNIKNQSCKIWRVNTEESSDEKTTPLLPLFLEIYMNTKSADDEENGNSFVAKTEWEKTKE